MPDYEARQRILDKIDADRHSTDPRVAQAAETLADLVAGFGQGEPGPTGPQGEPGPAGPQGEPGPAAPVAPPAQQ